MKTVSLFSALMWVVSLFTMNYSNSNNYVDYTFDGSITYEMNYVDKKGKEQTFPYKVYFSENTEMFAISVAMDDNNAPEETIMVYDKPDKKMHMLMTSKGEKTAMSIPFNPDKIDEMTEDIVSDDYKIEKTGNTKKILGYNCEEYKFSSDDGTGSVWITDETGISGKKIAGLLGMGGKGKNKNPFVGAQPDGLMLESHGTTEKGEKYHMLATDIKLDGPITISTEGYKSMMSFGK
ncbi:DUF4412 domain-containing protein [Marinigracilibium pacificum]|uniref:DUF4412 domain-containing protein n=1 Tax=Marinigracilibium pacificum TaxID=2729599 RepID=A0A848IT65_9BACT|nr:DUF4412 domain-containing protein [Marinigracilibium pacificum]NMM46966.1 DUF4412 domain-containing protein [Marinigracilibium pacificum]